MEPGASPRLQAFQPIAGKAGPLNLSNPSRWLTVVVGIAAGLFWLYERAPLRESAGLGAGTVESAFENRISGQMVEFSGRVVELLSDDDHGDRHQRFIVAVDESLTVLVAHNIDLAPRVPLDRGDEVRLRGQYEWNEKGGVVHWTHHDPDGSRRGTGWIRHQGRSYS